ncbi:iron ABC transporter permease [Anaerococcus sp. AGMB00486]|uniref:Iron ABC transporter permease n=1 Tax=Anaerococcus faecalis TaxID=2742993 RepID=A0ABX2N938_9FIRM|nr:MULTISPECIES: iron ABC transporter permease [Anaerococcus]MDY3007254.1 iron ABC transporter permease [Anaerococcus porci]NVF11158.1 iron ABC transporter permease [Anaerococcus faecalis]
MKSKEKNIDIWKIFTIVILIGLLLFLVYPIIRLLLSSVYVKGEGFTFNEFHKFFSKNYYFQTLLNSLKISSLATISTILLATPIAYIMSMYKIKGNTALNIIIVIASMSAPFIGAYSWILLLGRSGIITEFLSNVFSIKIPEIYGFKGILLVFSLQLYPLIFLYAKSAFENIDASVIEASENLGCVGLRRFFKIILPLIVPSLLAGSLLVFMRCMSDFGTPMLIGEGYRTFPVLIYNEFVGEVGTNQSFASAIAVIAIIFTSLVFIIQKKIAEKSAYSSNFLNPVAKKQLKGPANIIAHLLVYIVVFLSILPQIYLTYTSFKKTSGKIFIDGYSLKSYQTAISRLGNSIINSIVFPIIALLVIIVLSLIISYLVVRRKNFFTNLIDIFTMIPFILPGVVIGISLLKSFANGFGRSGFMAMGGTIQIIIISFVIRRMPYTLRSASSTLQQIPIVIEEAAISLGASKLKTFLKITVPMMASGLISGAILSFVTLISELSTSILLTNVKTKTMTVAIYTEVVRGNYGVAAALSTLLTIFTVIALVGFNLLGKNKNTNI